MSSVKIILWKHRKKSDGSFPLRLRITHNRKTRYISLGYHLQEKEWDEVKSKVKRCHPNYKRLNNLLIQKLAEANQTLIDLETEKKAITSKNIKNEIVIPLNQTTFKEMANSYLRELEQTNKFKRLSSDKTRVNHFIKFTNNNDLTFQDIDETLLKKFSIHLRRTKKVSERSIINNLIVIRTLFNRAIKLGIVDSKFYPFGKGKIQLKFPETEKVGLNIEEIQALESIEPSELTPDQNHARNIWLICFYFGGIRIGDLLKLKWKDIYDGRLHYRMGKNQKLLSLKVSEKSQKIFENYKADKKSKTNLIFPDLKTADLKDSKAIYRKEKIADKNLNKYIREVMEILKIDKHIGFHSARHSFAHLSNDIDVRQLQKIFRHSNITTTIGYMESIKHTDADDALEKVTGF